jgi:D-alanine--D-alanine ligase
MAQARLLILFGGVSSEHEISLRSAASVIAAVDRDRYTPVLVGIRRDGTWRTGPVDRDLADIVRAGEPVADLRALAPDIVFPVLHGPHGEDGTIQGLLEILGLPYVGSGVLASSSCMDKVAQKHLVGAAAPDIPMVLWRQVFARALADAPHRDDTLESIAAELGFPCFVKPANLGSSVGVHKVTSADELLPALADAARYDHSIVVERGVPDAREIEIAVLGDGGPDTFASAPGEIVLPAGVWYDYDTKYVKDVAVPQIPASLPAELADRIRALALRAFEVMGCRGLARIDFLLDRMTGDVYLNELNTMPGFTSISMYPKLMEHAGVRYPELIHRLCELALAHHRARRELTVER